MAKYQAYPEYKDSGVEWLGEIPAHWQVCRLKNLAMIRNGQDYKTVQAESGYPVMGSGGQFAYATEFMYDKPSVLLGRKGTIDKPLYVNVPFWTVDTMYYTEINSDIDAKYLYYLSLTILFSRYSTNTALPSMTQENLSNYFFSVPSDKFERSNIKDFLDHETKKIDSLIAQQQKLIELLKEKRQAVISHAVTKGLNPDVPMKDSGVEWLREVPEHWKVVTLRNLIRSGDVVIQDGNHGELHPVATEYVSDGIPFLMANNIREGKVDLVDCKRIAKKRADRLRIGFAKAGDMLLTHKGTVGEVAIIPECISEHYWMLTPQVTYYRWHNERIDAEFFTYQFQSKSLQTQLDVIGSKQSTRAYVGLIAQGELILVIPPVGEQQAVRNDLNNVISGFDEILENSAKFIDLMQERRTALISAAVTGKIDVRNWVAPAASEAASDTASQEVNA